MLTGIMLTITRITVVMIIIIINYYQDISQEGVVNGIRNR